MPIPYSSNYDVTLGFCGTAPQMALAQNIPLSYTVPGAATQKYVVTFSYPDDVMVYVALNATATVPTAGTINPNSVSEAKPSQRFVKGGDVLSFITPNVTTQCGISLRTITG